LLVEGWNVERKAWLEELECLTNERETHGARREPTLAAWGIHPFVHTVYDPPCYHNCNAKDGSIWNLRVPLHFYSLS
jgi:hypothetical protein